MAKISFKDTSFLLSAKSHPFTNGIRHGLEISSMVGVNPVLPAIYVLTKYSRTVPLSIIVRLTVATPSVSYIRDPALPGVLAKSQIVRPSENIF